MNQQQTIRPALLVTFFFGLIITVDTFAASLVKVELLTDGSVTPPGDVIIVSVLFAPQQRQFHLEARAYLVTGEKNEIITAVPARENNNEDENGLFTVRKTLRRKSETFQLVKTKIVIPYRDLAIEPGEHQLGYQVIGTDESQRQFFVGATPLSTVEITTSTRTAMTRKSEPNIVMKTLPITGFMYDLQTKTSTKLELKTFESEKTFLTPFLVFKTNIPGEYNRTMDAPHVPLPTKTPRENYTAYLKKSPWVSIKKRTVYFATNRNIKNNNSRDVDRFGNDPVKNISYGSISVNIPSEVYHKQGRIELPPKKFLWWEDRDPEKYFLVEALNTLTKERFLNTVSSQDDILLFVHGYRNSFKESAIRVAQLGHDLQFTGRSILFSWPSEGESANYKTDEKAAKQSEAALGEVILALVQSLRTSGNSDAKIHVIAHSMGNRVLLNSFYNIKAKLNNGEKPFGHIILAAPDMDHKNFGEIYEAVHKRAKTVSHYFNPNDKALLASRLIHLDSRVGQGPYFLNGRLDNIDSTNADTSFLGHGYFAAEKPLLIDIQLILNHNLRPPRITIRERTGKKPEQIYWAFP